MPNQHKHLPVSVRLPGDLRAWLIEYARAEGVPVNRIIVEALDYVRSQSSSSAVR